MVRININLPNGDKNAVETDLDHTLQEIMEAVCEINNMEPEGYIFRYKQMYLNANETLDLLCFPDGTILDLIKDERPTAKKRVKICLKLKDITASTYFNPEVTLWKMVKDIVSEDTLSLPFTTPALIYGKREFIGRELLQHTLESLGITSGVATFRFMMIDNIVLSRRSGRLTSEHSLNVYHEERESLDVNKLSSTSAMKIYNSVAVFHHFRTQKQVKFVHGVKARGESIQKELDILGKREAVAYRIPETKYEFDDEPDDFYDLTVGEVKMLYRQLKKARQELEEEPLLTKKKREEMHQREKLHHNVVIRVQFPDMTVLQGVFQPNERISDVLDFVNEHVRIKTDSAYLYTAPPKVVLEPSHTLTEANCVPTAKVYYGKKTAHPLFTAFLEEDILRHLSTHEAACHLAASCRSTLGRREGTWKSGKRSGSKRSDKRLSKMAKRPSETKFEKKGFSIL